jgi:hypothetical protein
MTIGWYELWADDQDPVPYILLLRPTAGGYEILDPAQGNQKAFETPSLEDARTWLSEDEFELVGHKEVDDGRY